ncbi:tRNA (adenosine(37)-N6)-threonylcarbamoyltransferase complex ATPase subunit type 1 TsaE [Mycoplasma sp. Mirounga ES2805-ORL]|uniref:tRNA (adenosine(37)-N6)-threonylcarbamoyltransferase complex ATPase subunit type 1 TsaE n=1 Tax=Mycoplasma sp. Mirounga ES2805-ORL TaxID=754514 RepID=UPI00197B1380|nr:tRNA (adenosine(37)-N6)-threonylcarbamoyltransferase complex ATPase subunit type 1 TsaE [Mycoplasma sp. Mirounga ES2805-ORL]QSF13774.1 tRNA (adenosine(37)-N6)-threonylcarbamoyltransferase complex ATPase subunit type 1 TsaE [Mycoplasma sp. Mirounga ES2805-ORL]
MNQNSTKKENKLYIHSKLFQIKNESDVFFVAEFVLQNLTKSKIILLNGDLGAGKTTLVKHIAKLINIKEPITSPTFNYMKNYEGLIHIDAYHLSEDLAEFEDYYENNIVAIEWADNIQHNYSNYLDIKITHNLANQSHDFLIKVVK